MTEEAAADARALSAAERANPPSYTSYTPRAPPPPPPRAFEQQPLHEVRLHRLAYGVQALTNLMKDSRDEEMNIYMK